MSTFTRGIGCIMLAGMIAGAALGLVAPEPPSDDLLRGPEVSDTKETSRRTLIEHGFEGRLLDIGPDPEREAVTRLELTEEQREAFRRVQGERAGVFDRIVREQYGLLVELGAVGENVPAYTRIIGELTRAFQPYVDRGTLLTEMKPHLTNEQFGEAQRMVYEYRFAQMSEIQQTVPDPAGRAALIARLRLEVFGQLVVESIERQVGFTLAAYERLAERLNLTTEQRAEVETIYAPLAIAEFRGTATPAERFKAFLAFRRILRPEQQQELLKVVIEEYQPPARKESEPGEPERGEEGMSASRD